VISYVLSVIVNGLNYIFCSTIHKLKTTKEHATWKVITSVKVAKQTEELSN